MNHFHHFIDIKPVWKLSNAITGYPLLLYVNNKIVQAKPYGRGTGSVYLSNTQCRGNETNLGQCQTSSWGNTYYYCSHYYDAGVSCHEHTGTSIFPTSVCRLYPWTHRYEHLTDISLPLISMNIQERASTRHQTAAYIHEHAGTSIYPTSVCRLYPWTHRYEHLPDISLPFISMNTQVRESTRHSSAAYIHEHTGTNIYSTSVCFFYWLM